MIRDTDIDAIPDRAFVGQFVYELVRRDNDGYVDGVAASYEYTELPNSFDPLQSFVDQISVQTYAYAHRPVFPPNNTTEGKFECADIYIAKCGDGMIDDGRIDPALGVTTPFAGETCDDGNLIDGDGCSAMCQIETTPSCTNITADPAQGSVPLETQVSCTQSGFDTGTHRWRLEIRDPDNNPVSNTIQTGSTFSIDRTLSTPGVYAAQCYIEAVDENGELLTFTHTNGTTQDASFTSGACT